MVLLDGLQVGDLCYASLGSSLANVHFIFVNDGLFLTFAEGTIVVVLARLGS